MWQEVCVQQMGLEAGGSIQSSMQMDSQSLTPHHWGISAVQLLFLVRRHSECQSEARATGFWTPGPAGHHGKTVFGLISGAEQGKAQGCGVMG